VLLRHGLRVSEACDLRWDDIDLAKRTVIVRRLKGSTDSSHYLERDELAGLKRLKREQEVAGVASTYVFVNERGQPFGRMGIARIIERAGEAARLPFRVHVHMLRHSTGFALANRGMDTRRLQHFLGHASNEQAWQGFPELQKSWLSLGGLVARRHAQVCLLTNVSNSLSCVDRAGKIPSVPILLAACGSRRSHSCADSEMVDRCSLGQYANNDQIRCKADGQVQLLCQSSPQQSRSLVVRKRSRIRNTRLPRPVLLLI
jgi:Phage integrase family